jgi:hypothetical protein
MKYLEKFFFRLNPREQRLLTILVWVALFLGCFKTTESYLGLYNRWNLTKDAISGYQGIINLKPIINQALEQQKIEQKNKSYNKKNLSNRASSLADKVFPARDYRELDTDERERYSQHRVKITFDRASYEQVNEFASLIRKESPFMFLSEVKIEPNYPPKSRPYDPTTFDASFEVSSVEFNDQ